MALVQVMCLCLFFSSESLAAPHHILKSQSHDGPIVHERTPVSARNARAAHSGCPKGHYLDGYDDMNQIKPDAECRKCPPESYNQEEDNLSMKCSMCTTCNEDMREREITQCSPFSNRECACIKGFTDDRPGPELVCVMIPITCQPGQRIVKHANETMCEDCPDEMTSSGNDDHCSPISAAQTETSDGNDQTNTGNIVIIISGVLVVVVILSITAVLIVYFLARKRRRKHADIPTESGDYAPLKDKNARKLIEKMAPELLGKITVNALVLTKLLAAGVINDDQKSQIQAEKNPNEKVDKLLSCVKLNGTRGLQVLQQTLADAQVNQNPAATLIEEYLKDELHIEIPPKDKACESLLDGHGSSKIGKTSGATLEDFSRNRIAQPVDDENCGNDWNEEQQILHSNLYSPKTGSNVYASMPTDCFLERFPAPVDSEERRSDIHP